MKKIVYHMNHWGSHLLFAQNNDGDLRSRWETIRKKLWHFMTKKGWDCIKKMQTDHNLTWRETTWPVEIDFFFDIQNVHNNDISEMRNIQLDCFECKRALFMSWSPYSNWLKLLLNFWSKTSYFLHDFVW